MLKFKIGDTVKITAGKDHGREAKIELVLPKENKVVIPGVNMYKKHVKGTGENKGGIYDLPRALGFGKIALLCPKCKKQTRVGFSLIKNDKIRICKKCGKEIDSK
ncbi:MAG TPA: 50S ribosomal protein L24 [Alphaproteobacteria bacterium]|jgi:large subunit ribosomal protein L24|nr:50S ribosomal protein L24 [Alphaproteobacteria bacterium]